MRPSIATAILMLTAALLCGCGLTGSTTRKGFKQLGGVSLETSALNGIYRSSTTVAQTKGTAAEGAENDILTSTSLVVAPDTMTITLQDGESGIVTTATARHDGGTYTADRHTLVIEWTILPPGEGPLHMEYAYSVADGGTLVLTAKPVTDPVDAFVYSRNPWIKIG